MRLGTASPGSRPLQPPTPTPSQALGKISKTGRSDAERFTVYLLPNAGIWEPTEREIRAKCGGGLDRNSGRSRSRTAGPLGSQEPDRCCGGKAMDQTPGWRIRLQCGRPGFDPWVGNFPWRRERLPTPVFWPGEFHGLYSLQGCKESDTTESGGRRSMLEEQP